jgi:hypothetical protein
MFVKDVTIQHIVMAKKHIQNVATNANTMKVQQHVQCLISVNFHC